MNKPAYTNRLKRQLSKKKISLSDAKIRAAVKDNYGKKPPSVVAALLIPKATKRTDKKVDAAKAFKPVLVACCNAFGVTQKQAKTEFSDNLRDLRSMAAYIGLRVLKLRPASALAEGMGLPTPAAVYHKSYRAEALIKEKRVTFCDKLILIKNELKLK